MCKYKFFYRRKSFTCEKSRKVERHKNKKLYSLFEGRGGKKGNFSYCVRVLFLYIYIRLFFFFSVEPSSTSIASLHSNCIVFPTFRSKIHLHCKKPADAPFRIFIHHNINIYSCLSFLVFLHINFNHDVYILLRSRTFVVLIMGFSSILNGQSRIKVVKCIKQGYFFYTLSRKATWESNHELQK